MAYLHLNLTSNESTYEYSFSQDFLDKKYEIGLVKLDGRLELGKYDQNNNEISSVKLPSNIFIWCNLIDDYFINNKRINALYRLKLNGYEDVNEEPSTIVFHKVVHRPNKIVLKLIDINNNVIEFDKVNLFVELHLKELAS